jgi:hypothetical protein
LPNKTTFGEGDFSEGCSEVAELLFDLFKLALYRAVRKKSRAREFETAIR